MFFGQKSSLKLRLKKTFTIFFLNIIEKFGNFLIYRIYSHKSDLKIKNDFEQNFSKIKINTKID